MGDLLEKVDIYDQMGTISRNIETIRNGQIEKLEIKQQHSNGDEKKPLMDLSVDLIYQ